MLGSYQAAGSLFPEMASLQQQLEELFQPARMSGIRSLARGAFPAVNVGATADAFQVIAFVPGVDPKEIDITIERGLLTISGERHVDPAQRQSGTDAYAAERFAGKFRRVITLADDADPGKVEAKYRDGVLQVIVSKRESSKPRQISIN